MSVRFAPLVLLVVFSGGLPSPGSPQAEIAPLAGPLVLASGQDVPKEVRAAFFALAGKDQAKIVVIPTALATADEAATIEEVLKSWRELKAASVVVLHTRDRKTADDPEFVKPLAEATAVWFPHGQRDRILKAYRGTRVEKELKKLQARGGVVGGTGSGAAVLGELVITPEDRLTEAGLGLLPGFFIEDGGTERLAEALAANPAYPALAIAENTAVVIEGREGRVVGESTVTLHLAKGGGRAANAEVLRKPPPPRFPARKPEPQLDLFQLRRAAANRTAKEPFPPAKPGEPVVEKGSLVIAGGKAGPVAEIWKKFIELAGGPDAPIVMIPTALDDPTLLDSGKPTEVVVLKRNGAKNVAVLHTESRKEADDPKFSEVLTRAKGVWFGGGRQWRFVDAYEGTLTEKRIHEVLTRGGAIGGSSAGASIQSEYMPRGHPVGNFEIAVEGYERGFGFLPGCAVDQHFFRRMRTGDMTKLMRLHPQYLGIGIDEGTAIVVTGGTAEVMGVSKVAFYDTRKKPAGARDYEELKPGEKYDLKAREKVE